MRFVETPVFTATTKLTFTARAEGDSTGLVIMGADYAWLGLVKRGNGNPLGVMLWDASYDQVNGGGGQPYSARLKAQMR